jgi:hypothetical protein
MNILQLATQIESDYGVVIGRPDLSKELAETNLPVFQPVNFSPYTDYAQGGFITRRLLACCQYGGGIKLPFFITIIGNNGDDNSWELADDGAYQLTQVNKKAQQAEADAVPALSSEEIKPVSAGIKIDLSTGTAIKRVV